MTENAPAARMLCLGEALIDVVTHDGEQTEVVGGSILNVAIGLASLGHPTSLATWIGSDERGQRLAGAASTAGVELVAGSEAASQTPIAIATIDDEGRASYQFELEWRLPDLTQATAGHLHTGSFAATLEPGGSQVEQVLRARVGQATISYDPNIRPSLMGSPDDVRDRIESLVAISTVVKASDEDLAWLYPGRELREVMEQWLASGPQLMVLTQGPQGAWALLRSHDELLTIAGAHVEVGDTVGAGDSFMAGLLSSLVDDGLLGSADLSGWQDAADAVLSALARAVRTSSLTVTKVGAYAPSRSELKV